MEKIQIVLAAKDENEPDKGYAALLSDFFMACQVEAEIGRAGEKPLSDEVDALIVMGSFSSEVAGKALLESAEKKHLPVVLFGVDAGEGEGPYLREMFPHFALASAQKREFMRQAEHYLPIVGDPMESREALRRKLDRPEGFEKESEPLEKQMLFVSEILELIRQHRLFRAHAGKNDAQELFDLAENARAKREYHLARLLYEKAYQMSKNDLVLFRLAETEDLRNHPENVRAMMQKAVRNNPGEIAKAMQNKYVYNENGFRNKFIEKCPICGQKGFPYMVSWAPNNPTYDSRFDPIRVWMYCPDCHHGFANNIPANLQAIFEDDYTFLTEYNPTTQYSAVLNFSEILSKIGRYTAGKRLLDVGAGQGELALAALQHGYDYTGVEVIPAYANNVQRLIQQRIYCNDFMKLEQGEASDVIIAGDVIEHVEDVHAFIEKVASHMDGDTVLWLSTPDMFSPHHKLRKDGEGMPKEVWHLNYFTRQSLELLFGRAGLEIVELCISPRYLGSIEVLAKKKPQ